MKAITHVYATAGSFDAEMSLSAYADDGGIEGAAPEVDVSAATVSLIAQGDATAYEGGPYAGFEVTWGGSSGEGPLTVNYTLGGTLDSTAYIVTDENGEILDGSFTIPEGQNYDYLYVVPLEDHTPRWTDTVNITLTSGTDYTPASDASAAGCYVVNDDLTVYLDNGSDNEILDGSSDGESDLVPLVVDVPEDVRDGAVITLTDNADTEADVWMTADPGEDDQPILGDVNGTYVGSVTWTQGEDDTAPSGKTTFYVGGTDGSSSLNDINFGLSDSDANCTVDGTDSDPIVAQDPPPQPTTANSISSNSATAIAVKIISLDDPNAGEPTGNVAGKTRNWLAGQLVDLMAEVVGPPGVGRYASFTWSVPGNTAYSYYDDDNIATVMPLLPNEIGDFGLLPRYMGTGTSKAEVQFFWVNTDSDDDSTPDTDQVSVTANILSISPPVTATMSASTTFNVYEPVSSLTVSGTSTSLVDTAHGLIVALQTPNGTPGITMDAQVQMQPAFNADAQGSFKFVQLFTVASTLVETSANGTGRAIRSAVQPVLDYNDPYLVVNGMWAANNSDAIFDTGSTVGEMEDSPSSQLNNYPHSGYLAYLARDQWFNTYLMFKPPGGRSEWVPLLVEDWSWHVTVIGLSANRFAISSADGPSGGDVQSATDEPTWLANGRNVIYI